MTSSKSRKARNATGPELTAQPKSMVQELKRRGPERGLSVDPDELGAHFLADATAQGNFESSDGEPPELSLLEGATSDEALVGPSFEQDDSVWEHTVDLARQNRDEDVTREVFEGDDTQRDVEPPGSSVHEGSLLDSETDETSER